MARTSRFARDFRTAAQAFMAGYKLVDQIMSKRERDAKAKAPRALTPAQLEKQKEEDLKRKYQDDAERGAVGRADGKGTGGGAGGGGGGGTGEGGAIPTGLLASESGGKWNAENDAVGSSGRAGHFGRLQFGRDRIDDAVRAGVLPAGTTGESFRDNPKLQAAAEEWHFKDIDKLIYARGFDKRVGDTINGVPVTMEGMRRVAHLGGKLGLEKFIDSDGKYNPADRNGTRLMDYFSMGVPKQDNPLRNTKPLSALPTSDDRADAPDAAPTRTAALDTPAADDGDGADREDVFDASTDGTRDFADSHWGDHTFDDGEYDNVDTMFAADGGLVAPDREDMTQFQALPTDGADAAPAASPSAIPDSPSTAPAAEDDGSSRSLFDAAKANGVSDAVHDGFRWIQNFFGFGKPQAGAIPDPAGGDAKALRAFAANTEAPTASEIREVDKMIDPNGKLAPHERSLARMYGLRKYYLERGETDKAERTAAGMMLYAKETLSMGGAIVEGYLRKGNLAAAGKAAEKAFSELPDGKRIEVTPDGKNGLNYKLYDADGTLTDQGKMALQELMRISTGMQDGSVWFDYMNRMATAGRGRGAAEGGGRAASSRSPRAPAPPRPSAAERAEERGDRAYAADLEGEAGRIANAANRQRTAANDANDADSGEGVRARAKLGDEITRAQVNDTARFAGLVQADTAFRKAAGKEKDGRTRFNTKEFDADEAAKGAGTLFGNKDGSDPFGAINEKERTQRKNIVLGAASRAMSANPGMTSEVAGRQIAMMMRDGYVVTSDGKVYPRAQGGGRAVPAEGEQGMYLDRRSLEDIDTAAKTKSDLYRRGEATRPGTYSDNKPVGAPAPSKEDDFMAIDAYLHGVDKENRDAKKRQQEEGKAIDDFIASGGAAPKRKFQAFPG